MHFKRVKKSRKLSDFVIYSYFKDSVFTAVKRDAKFQTRYVKGVPFLSKMLYTYKRVSGWTSGRSLPVQNVEDPPPEG